MKHLTQSFVLYLSHELLNLARKTQYHAKKIRIKNAVSGSFIFFQSGQNGKRRKAYNNPAYWSNYSSGYTNRSRNSALTAVTEDIVGPEYQFGLFLFTEFLTQFKVQTIIRPAGHCPCFVPIISIKIVSSHKKTFPEKPPAIGHYRLFEILSFTGG